jgi:hypothetical protein
VADGLTDANVRSSLWSVRIEGDFDLGRRKLDLLARLALERATGRGEDRAIHIMGPVLAPALKALPAAPGRS